MGTHTRSIMQCIRKSRSQAQELGLQSNNNDLILNNSMVCFHWLNKRCHVGHNKCKFLHIDLSKSAQQQLISEARATQRLANSLPDLVRDRLIKLYPPSKGCTERPDYDNFQKYALRYKDNPEDTSYLEPSESVSTVTKAAPWATMKVPETEEDITELDIGRSRSSSVAAVPIYSFYSATEEEEKEEEEAMTPISDSCYDLIFAGLQSGPFKDHFMAYLDGWVEKGGDDELINIFLTEYLNYYGWSIPIEQLTTDPHRNPWSSQPPSCPPPPYTSHRHLDLFNDLDLQGEISRLLQLD